MYRGRRVAVDEGGEHWRGVVERFVHLVESVGFGVYGVRFGVCGLGFGVCGLGFGVWVWV